MKVDAAVVAALLCASACSSGRTTQASSVPVSSTDSSTTTSTPLTTTTTEAAVFDPSKVAKVTVEGPVTGGAGKAVLGAPTIDLAKGGYVEEEYFISGTASSYTTSRPLGSDGTWSVTPAQTADFTTRILVRRPKDVSKFNGSVAVEWLNVSAGFDNSPDWIGTHTELVRSGWAWVGVSAQKVGIVGGKNAVVPFALQLADPVRYAALTHPGDSYSYDIFSQAGAAVRNDWHQLLGGPEPTKVFAFGESQSAFRLTTYINAVAPLVNVYDGYLVHSRGARGADLSQSPLKPVATPDPTTIRTDLSVPVLMFQTETDLLGAGLGFQRARQTDTSRVRTWEVAGTAHEDYYGLGAGDSDDGSAKADEVLFSSMSSPPNAIYGGIITCTHPINTGPHSYVLRAAVSALDSWARTGSPPAATEPIVIAGGAAAVDEHGNVQGGVRTPQVDVPVATLSGYGQEGAKNFCALFGTTKPLDPRTLASLYPSHDEFVAKWKAALDAAVVNRAILDADAANLLKAATDSTIGNPG